MKDIKDIYQEGCNAYLAGKNKTSNPYKDNEHFIWNKGYEYQELQMVSFMLEKEGSDCIEREGEKVDKISESMGICLTKFFFHMNSFILNLYNKKIPFISRKKVIDELNNYIYIYLHIIYLINFSESDKYLDKQYICDLIQKRQLSGFSEDDLISVYGDICLCDDEELRKI